MSNLFITKDKIKLEIDSKNLMIIQNDYEENIRLSKLKNIFIFSDIALDKAIEDQILNKKIYLFYLDKKGSILSIKKPFKNLKNLKLNSESISLSKLYILKFQIISMINYEKFLYQNFYGFSGRNILKNHGSHRFFRDLEKIIEKKNYSESDFVKNMLDFHTEELIKDTLSFFNIERYYYPKKLSKVNIILSYTYNIFKLLLLSNIERKYKISIQNINLFSKNELGMVEDLFLIVKFPIFMFVVNLFENEYFSLNDFGVEKKRTSIFDLEESLLIKNDSLKILLKLFSEKIVHHPKNKYFGRCLNLFQEILEINKNKKLFIDYWRVNF